MSRRTRQTGGGLTDRLPIARGAALGAAAYVVGYIITYLFVEIESDGVDMQSAVSEFGSTFGADVGTTDIVGWMFYNAQFVDVEVSGEAAGQSQSASVSMLSEASDLTIPEPIWYLVPIICLVGAGYLTAMAVKSRGDSGEAAKAGATVIAGYLPLAAIGAFIFTKSGEYSAGFGQSVSMSFGPEMMMAILLAGIGFPLIFGAIGGAVASQGTSTGGGYQRRSPRQQQPPQQGNPPQQGRQQGHAGQPPQGGQQGQGQSNQGNQRRR